MVDKKEGESQDADILDEENQEEELDEQEQQDQSDDSSEEQSDDNNDSGEPTLKDIMNLLKQEREERKKLQTKLDSVVSSNKKLANSQLEMLRADVKALGFDVTELTKGLNDKQAEGVLRNIKSNMAGKRSLSSTPGKTGKPGGNARTKVDDIFQGALRFLGMDEETYLELSGKKKVE